MKILLLTAYFAPHRGGSEIFLETLGRRLFQEDETWTTDVITYNTEKVAAEENFLSNDGKKIGTIYRLKTWEILRSQFALPNYFQLLGLIKKWQKNKVHYDLIISNTRFFDNSQWAPKIAKIFGAKSVLIDYCADHPNHENKIITKMAAIADNYLSYKLKDKYNLVIATSKATKEFLKKLNLQPNEQVIYNGVDEEFFIKAKAEKSVDKITITFAGRLIKNKHPELFLEAAINLLNKFPELEFNLAGDGPLLNGLRVKWKTLEKDKKKKIKNLGPLKREALAKLLWQTHLFVHPSTHSEGMPTVLEEAGFCGDVIIATPVGDAAEVVKNDLTGTVISEKPTANNIEEAIIKYLNNKNLIKTQSKNIQKIVTADFTLKKQIVKFKTLIEKLF